MDITNVPYIIAACCVLNNICKIHGEAFNEEWLQDDLDQPNDHELDNATSSSTCGRDVCKTLLEYFKVN